MRVVGKKLHLLIPTYDMYKFIHRKKKTYVNFLYGGKHVEKYFNKSMYNKIYIIVKRRDAVKHVHREGLGVQPPSTFLENLIKLLLI